MLQEGQYPLYVQTEEERLRFRTAVGIARELFGEDGEAQVWMAGRSIYRSDIPT